MPDLIHSPLGGCHLGAAVLALLTGTLVLLLPKATARHRQIGYVYVVSMLMLNATAFGIYHLFGRFGPFHVAAALSSVSILGGMVPMLFRRRVSDWIYYHYYFMNWSVVGLYAAFWAETFVRFFPMNRFWWVVIVATGLTAGIGSRLIRQHKTALTGRYLAKTKKPQTTVAGL